LELFIVSTLKNIANNLWCVDQDSKFMLFHVGTRMTIVRLENGKLLLHSPVIITPALKQALELLGEVSHIVCPNDFHHLYAKQALSLYPHAQLHGPASLHKKRKDLAFDAVFNEIPHADWHGQLIPLSVHGSLMHETVLFHPSSNTLITSDIVENFVTSPHLLTRIWLKVGGCHGKISWPRILRLVYLNRTKARASFNTLFELPFTRVIIAHGDIIEKDAKQKLKEGLSWLL
jgi:hypothetical protein